MKSEKNPAGRRKNRSVLEKYNGSKLGWLHDVIVALEVILLIFGRRRNEQEESVADDNKNS